MQASLENRIISITLTDDEALVLLEWFHNLSQIDRPALIQDQSETRVLFDLESELERVVAGDFAADYGAILSKARKRLRDKE